MKYLACFFLVAALVAQSSCTEKTYVYRTQTNDVYHRVPSSPSRTTPGLPASLPNPGAPSSFRVQ